METKNPYQQSDRDLGAADVRSVRAPFGRSQRFLHVKTFSVPGSGLAQSDRRHPNVKRWKTPQVNGAMFNHKAEINSKIFNMFIFAMNSCILLIFSFFIIYYFYFLVIHFIIFFHLNLLGLQLKVFCNWLFWRLIGKKRSHSANFLYNYLSFCMQY